VDRVIGRCSRKVGVIVTTSCCVCAAPCVEPIAVGDLPGGRAADVVCSLDCEDEAISDAHNDARVEGERCGCMTCWRVARRRSHTEIERYRAQRAVAV